MLLAVISTAVIATTAISFGGSANVTVQGQFNISSRRFMNMAGDSGSYSEGGRKE
ncbi:MAG: hypothetical protein WBL68_17965 [Nitrososphaeraceae archaeon]